MDGKVVHFRQSRHFDFEVVLCKVIFHICTLILRVHSQNSCQEKVKTGKMKVQIFLSHCTNDYINQYESFLYYKTLKQKIDFSSERQSIFNYYSRTITFPVENGNS